MNGYAVEINQLRDASKAARSAADQARVVQPGNGLGDIAQVLPGGDAANAAPALALTFNDRAAGWAREIDRWSDETSSAADRYAGNEAAAEGAFGG